MGGFGVSEYRLETDTESPDFVIVIGLGAFAYVRDGIDVSWLKRTAIVLEYKASFRKRESRLGCAGIFSVLQ